KGSDRERSLKGDWEGALKDGLPALRYMNAAIASRVILRLGLKSPSGYPVVMPRSGNQAISSSKTYWPGTSQNTSPLSNGWKHLSANWINSLFEPWKTLWSMGVLVYCQKVWFRHPPGSLPTVLLYRATHNGLLSL